MMLRNALKTVGKAGITASDKCKVKGVGTSRVRKSSQGKIKGPGEKRIALWHKYKHHKISGFTAPMLKNLEIYLKLHPEYEIYQTKKELKKEALPYLAGSNFAFKDDIFSESSTYDDSSDTSLVSAIEVEPTSFSNSELSSIPIQPEPYFHSFFPSEPYSCTELIDIMCNPIDHINHSHDYRAL